MKKAMIILSTLLLLATITLAQEMQKSPAAPKEKSGKKAKAALPTSDADIQKCIEERFANSESMKGNPPKVMVSGGVATITGEAKNGGQKGGATRSAKSCGAKEVKNEMTVAAKKK